MAHRSDRELNGVERVLCALGALLLAAICIRLALGFLPARSVAQQSGRLAPWLILWGLTWLATLSGVAVAWFLLADPRRTK